MAVKGVGAAFLWNEVRGEVQRAVGTLREEIGTMLEAWAESRGCSKDVGPCTVVLADPVEV